MNASWAGHNAIVRILFEAGADKDAKNHEVTSENLVKGWGGGYFTYIPITLSILLVLSFSLLSFTRFISLYACLAWLDSVHEGLGKRSHRNYAAPLLNLGVDKRRQKAGQGIVRLRWAYTHTCA